MKAINISKILLVEKGKPEKWKSEQLGKDSATVSRWCNNHAQPFVEFLLQTAELLNIGIREMI